jgi:hypothetical protein
MANPGIGFRRVWDVLLEISFHLLQPAVFTTLSAPVASGNSVVAQVPATANIYVGAQLVVDLPPNQETVTVISVGTTSSPPGPEFTANFAKSHSIGAMVAAATFPLQSATDPVYTQSEMALFLARAQNQFLFDVPCIFQITHQAVTLGKIIQATPANAIEIEHVASSVLDVPISSATRISNIVTATSFSPHGLLVGNKFSMFGSGAIFGGDGAFVVATVPGTTTLTYSQIAANGSTDPIQGVGNATRIQSSGGSSVLKYEISLGSGVAGHTYAASVLVKNQGPTAVTVNMNAGSSPQVINPGQVAQVNISFFENGNGCGVGVPCSQQLRFNTASAADAMDIVALNPVYTDNGGANLLTGANLTFAGSWVNFSGNTITLIQNQPSPLTPAGSLVLWSRLYETTQEELSMSQGSSWRNQFLTALNSWFEDRTGIYQWGVGGIPSTGFPIEMISSMRDTDALALTDGFLAPDLVMHLVKYKALEYAWSKEGEARNPMMAQFMSMRYQRGVMAVKRWMNAAGLMVIEEEKITGAGGRRA